jgi:hypothetical protein
MPPPPVASIDFPAVAGAVGLALSSDGRAVFLADGTAAIKQLDRSNPAAAPTTLLTLAAGETATLVQTYATTAGDNLAIGVSDGAGFKLHLAGLRPGQPQPVLDLGTAPLANRPVMAVASAGGSWVYVLEEDASGSGWLEAVQAHRLQLNQAGAVLAPMPLGTRPRALELTEDGRLLYVAYGGADADPVAGGVALVDVSEYPCNALWERALDGCPACDDDCLVLATIDHYVYGQKITTTAIDNRSDRRLLPGTSLMTDVINCMLERGGSAGERGEPGPPGNDGAPGADGRGVDAVTYHSLPCDQPGSAQLVDVGGVRTLVLDVPRGCDAQPPPPVQLTHICAISWDHAGDHPRNFVGTLLQEGLLIAFDRHVRNGDIDQHSFLLLGPNRDDRTGFTCWCQLEPKRVGGVVLDLDQGPNPGTCRINGILDQPSQPNTMVNGAQYLISGLPDALLRRDLELRVVFKGDLVRDEARAGVDANHLPLWLPNEPSGDGVEGGTFESWFRIRAG